MKHVKNRDFFDMFLRRHGEHGEAFPTDSQGNQFNSLAADNPVLTRGEGFTVKYTYSFLK